MYQFVSGFINITDEAWQVCTILLASQLPVASHLTFVYSLIINFEASKYDYYT